MVATKPSYLFFFFFSDICCVQSHIIHLPITSLSGVRIDRAKQTNTHTITKEEFSQQITTPLF